MWGILKKIIIIVFGALHVNPGISPDSHSGLLQSSTLEDLHMQNAYYTGGLFIM